MDYSFHFYNSLAETGAMMALDNLLGETDAPPVILCVGSDLAIGDSLGPITGTLLKHKAQNFCGYIYGTLKTPVTAKEVKYLTEFFKKTHPGSKIIAVDAAVGDDNDVGLIKISDGAIRPGSGTNKRLGRVGDVSVLGIVARKSTFSYTLLNLTRLNMVYAMSEIISGAIAALLLRKQERRDLVCAGKRA